MQAASGAPFPSRRRLLLGVALGVLLGCLAGLLVVAPEALLHWDSSALETWYGNTTLNLVAASSAHGVPNQASQTAESVSRGRVAYMTSCAQCHGATGDGTSMFGPNTFPYATSLASQDATAKTDAELFWIVKHGLGFTAMPGFAAGYRDGDISAIVAYVRSLQRDGS